MPNLNNTLLVLLAVLLGACAGQPESPASAQAAMSAAELAAAAGVQDDRGRFREILCAVLDERGESVPDYRPCDEALTDVGEEAGANGLPVALGNTEADYLVLLVPGLGWECFEDWLDLEQSRARYVGQFGYEVTDVPVDGLSSTANNARQIRDYVAALPPELSGRPIIMMGYSKGAPDILEAVTGYPELQQRVVAVVSLAGAVGGSPLADDVTQGPANMVTKIPGIECGLGDEGAIASLGTAERGKWLAEHTLPEHIRFYSVVAYPEPGRISRGLKNSHRQLSAVDARNDTQVTIKDQMIPGSTLIAYVNADHWAVAVPVARTHKFVGNAFVNHNDFPREAMFEALLRYLEEDLAQAHEQGSKGR